MERWRVHNRAEPGNCTCGPDHGNVCHKLLQTFLFITPTGIMPGVLYSLGTNLEISATLKSRKTQCTFFITLVLCSRVTVWKCFSTQSIFCIGAAI